MKELAVLERKMAGMAAMKRKRTGMNSFLTQTPIVCLWISSSIQTRDIRLYAWTNLRRMIS